MKFEYMTKQFYKDSSYAFEQQLNELGQKGWELVTIVLTRTPMQRSSVRSTPTYKSSKTAYFKREIERETQVLK